MTPYGQLDHTAADQWLECGSLLAAKNGFAGNRLLASYALRASLRPEPVADGSRIVAPLPPHLLPVLDQLLRAPTDIAASRMLDISTRTFSRRVAEILEHLGVQTRFQGGVTIALSGWVEAARGDGAAGERDKENS